MEYAAIVAWQTRYGDCCEFDKDIGKRNQEFHTTSSAIARTSSPRCSFINADTLRAVIYSLCCIYRPYLMLCCSDLGFSFNIYTISVMDSFSLAVQKARVVIRTFPNQSKDLLHQIFVMRRINERTLCKEDAARGPASVVVRAVLPRPIICTASTASIAIIMSGLPNRMETSRLTHPKPDRTWAQWWAGEAKKVAPANSTDCATNPIVQEHLRQMLDFTEVPNTFKLRDVARMLKPEELAALGFQKEDEAMPGLLELAFEWRELGLLEILQKGEVIGDDVEFYERKDRLSLRCHVASIISIASDRITDYRECVVVSSTTTSARDIDKCSMRHGIGKAHAGEEKTAYSASPARTCQIRALSREPSGTDRFLQLFGNARKLACSALVCWCFPRQNLRGLCEANEVPELDVPEQSQHDDLVASDWLARSDPRNTSPARGRHHERETKPPNLHKSSTSLLNPPSCFRQMLSTRPLNRALLSRPTPAPALRTTCTRPFACTARKMGKDAKVSADAPKHEMVYFPKLTNEVRAFGQFRKVMHTGLYSQLVSMEIPVGGDIGDEVHTVDQVLIFTSGTGRATVAGKDQDVAASDVVVVPAGTQHQFVNTSKTQPLELVTIYSPAEHDPRSEHKTKEEGDEEEDNGKDEAPEWSQQSKKHNESRGYVKESGGPYENGDDGRHEKS
nr:uncharacterized protein yrkc [Quercus suber]